MFYFLFISLIFSFAHSSEAPKNPALEQQDYYDQLSKLIAEAPKTPPLERQDSYDRLIKALKGRMISQLAQHTNINDTKIFSCQCPCGHKKPRQPNTSNTK